MAVGVGAQADIISRRKEIIIATFDFIFAGIEYAKIANLPNQPFRYGSGYAPIRQRKYRFLTWWIVTWIWCIVTYNWV